MPLLSIAVNDWVTDRSLLACVNVLAKRTHGYLYPQRHFRYNNVPYDLAILRTGNSACRCLMNFDVRFVYDISYPVIDLNKKESEAKEYWNGLNRISEKHAERQLAKSRQETC
nr:hypothetical protein BgiMline_033429 [Biomphalaria glabrata]